MIVDCWVRIVTKINLFACESLPLMKALPLLMEHFLHHLIEHIGPRLTLVIGQIWCSSESIHASFLHPPLRLTKVMLSHTDSCRIIIIINTSSTTTTYWVAPLLQSLVDGLRMRTQVSQNGRCSSKTLTPYTLPTPRPFSYANWYEPANRRSIVTSTLSHEMNDFVSLFFYSFSFPHPAC